MIQGAKENTRERRYQVNVPVKTKRQEESPKGLNAGSEREKDRGSTDEEAELDRPASSACALSSGGIGGCARGRRASRGCRKA